MISSASTGSPKRVCVVGLGYIGLPTAVFIAKAGYEVVGVDIKESFVNKINNGDVPFFEPDFEALLKEVVSNGSLKAQTTTPTANVYIVAVPTPFKEHYEVDDSFIMAAATGIAEKLEGGGLVILESTSPPGTTQRMADQILKLRSDLTSKPGLPNSVYFAHCPERVLPGQIVREMAENDRVIGGLNGEANELTREVYSSFCNGELLLTDATTAEMAKLTENSFRDVNIAFANELSLISDRLGIDVWELIDLANHHPRVNILNPGPGVGGHCIAVDPWFIVSAVPEEAKLIRTAREINSGKPAYVVESLKSAAEEAGPQSKVAILGLAFKADIDDLRESPAVEITANLSQELGSHELLVVEPFVDKLPDSLAERPNVTMTEQASAIELADVIAVLVDHTQFKEISPTALAGKTVVDTRGLFRKK
ncbi:UDP-N-acetyl-D-mannosamine dehydrogenase [Corynebacterium sp. TAE3-ERU16]|uniref:UDP-N-acetyl-D-mannosamine dehydrogenase n=1 Tax=Corynebacterium sp. TAE3-ERU16 TaxID=2849493 RepID=UPI001C4753E1|nr:UDP-N-acetyl-D-mannosamine dehydrogenase [Corynebacterium sp. TAE3-ERU16]MBV7294236.1 UDP-N-acetyl-D-mannosamine dehydrogenase [Corynebacterium sp. TAE3-ERU16]